MSFEKNIQASRIEGLIDEIALLGGLAGSGTLNYVAKFTPDGATLGPSSIFDNGTNVGISTSTPTARLHIIGNDATSGNYSLKVENIAASNLLYVRNDGVSLFGSTVSIDGKDVTNYPISVVSAHATLTRLKFLNAGNAQTDIQIGNNNGTNSIYYGVNTSGNSFIDNRNGNLLFQNTGTTQMTFDSSGNLGIGTTSPTASLQVEGSVAYSLKLKNLDATSAARVLLTSHNESNNFAIVTYGSSSAFPDRSSISTGHGKNLDIDLGSSPAGTFRIARADGYTTPSFFIDGSNERIGLGTTSPLSKLYVNASIQNEQIVLNNDDITGSSYFGLAQSGGIKAGMILLNSNHPFIPKTLILRNLWDNGGIRINGGSGDTNIMYFDTTTLNVGIGTINPAAYLDVNGDFATRSAASATAITATTNDLSTSGRSFIRLSNTTGVSQSVTGLANGYDGKRLVVSNVGADDIVLTNQDAGSVAANRIITGNAGTSTTVKPNDSIELIYDAVTARWRIINL